MKDIYAINNSLDAREFRNYVNSLLLKQGFVRTSIDDERLSDADPLNDNDVLGKMGKYNYTIQTFLNNKITKEHVDEVVADMEKEHVTKGILVSNKVVDLDVVSYANSRSVDVWDKNKLEGMINNTL